MREMKESETKAPIIREMTPQDVPAAALIERTVFSMPWKEADFLEMIEADYAYYYVACTEDSGTEKIVGIIGLRDISGEGEITNVAVEPEFRRRGIGRLMLDKVLEEARQLGIRDITLEVRESNAGAIKLYEKAGFVGEGVRPNFYEHPTEGALIMWKRDNF